mgnify:CR=1 FL=1
MNPLEIYKKLYKHFGPQGWWPIFDKKTGRCEYRERKNLSNAHKFEICLGAILTQNTAWKNVERALRNLASAGCLSPQKIIRSRNLAMLIKPAGYYNQKARKLKIFAKFWLDLTVGHSASYSREKLLSLWGIGPETADSILLYAAKRPVFVIDAYTKRLCGLFGIKFAKYDDYRVFFESRLPRSAKLYNEFHALIVAWGKMYGDKKRRGEAIKIISSP